MHRARSLLLAVPLLLAACGEGSGDDPTLEEPAASGPSSSETTAPPTTPPPPIPQATPEDAVQMLIDAWLAGDQGSAYTVADAQAVAALFAVPPETPEPRGCNEPGANVNITCVYRLDAGELQIRAAPRGDGYVVDFVMLGGP